MIYDLVVDFRYWSVYLNMEHQINDESKAQFNLVNGTTKCDDQTSNYTNSTDQNKTLNE